MTQPRTRAILNPSNLTIECHPADRLDSNPYYIDLEWANTSAQLLD